MHPFILSVLLFSLVPQDSLQQLNQYRWEKRPVFLFAPSPKHAALQEQLKNFKLNKKQLTERDVILLLCASSAEHSLLRKQFKIKANSFTAILIGKDGGEKWRSEKPFLTAELLQRIDAMPMGQEEAKIRKTQP